MSPNEWEIVGAFDATSREAFERHEVVEELDDWSGMIGAIRFVQYWQFTDLDEMEDVTGIRLSDGPEHYLSHFRGPVAGPPPITHSTLMLNAQSLYARLVALLSLIMILFCPARSDTDADVTANP